MRLSLGASLLIHVILLLSLQEAFPIPWLTEGLRTYTVELIRPPVEDLGEEMASHAEIGPVRDDRPVPPPDDQETITLDTQDKRYVSYARVIKERIMHHWRYPPEARLNLVEGRLTVLFSLTRAGHATRVDILRPSGFPILDQEAMRAIRAAAPFPPFPEHVTVGRLNIEASFDYRLTARK
ncbi:MAG: energy transducer TonB [Deltaproteobacteria bacterium]|nr:energy transducer TonB [Deltaproteobacteria bacterium]